jgi:transposase
MEMSYKHLVPSKDDLLDYYNTVKSISKTARHFKTSNPTVRKWLKSYSIPIYTHKEAVNQDFLLKKVDIPSKEELIFLYNNISISDIRNMYNIGQETFYEWLETHNIDKLSISDKVKTIKKNKFDERFNLTKEQIQEDYNKIQCMGGLADYYKCSMNTIKKLFKLHNIEAKFAKTSVGQLQVANYIESLGFKVILNDRKLIAPLELDIVIPEKNIAIEYCGIYFHSETWGNKDKKYHLNKQQLANKQRYKLITIFENEWFNKKDIVKSILSIKLGKCEKKIHARKTIFKEVMYKDIKQFENDNHLQGTRPANRYYVLCYDNEIMMSLSIGKSRFNKNITNEIVRMTTKKNMSVVGGISKLIKNIKINDCLTYADKRYGDGIGYEKVGFVKLEDSFPNYFYFHKKDHNNLYSRNKFQKHKIPNVDLSKTEYENMLSQDYDRIWDCGNAVYYYK